VTSWPPKEDIAEALDALDYLDAPTIQRMRGVVERQMRRVAASRGTGGTATVATDMALRWTPPQIAILLVVYLTSTEFLERAMRD